MERKEDKFIYFWIDGVDEEVAQFSKEELFDIPVVGDTITLPLHDQGGNWDEFKVVRRMFSSRSGFIHLTVEPMSERGFEYKRRQS